MTPYMSNAQWAVTDYGMETIASRNGVSQYLVRASRLLETTASRYAGRALRYEWPVHLAGKRWVDPELFIEAFKAALAIHAKQYKGAVDWAMLEASCDEMRRIRGDAIRYEEATADRGLIIGGFHIFRRDDL